ncbi:hypothetical protein LTR37_000475 [Vermiconidia calcicola]|uniref:Uncharacterized protein n=1 Tax=Vermiconidia calcicola TaxID=1690605 RepID=A0ACC3NYX8_9PEZI|nr:hypothetical protein LTR37_000475 [Vermiconidia calcicola]
MEDLLARERAAEQNVHYLLQNRDEPVLSLFQAFEEYRQITDACIFADYEAGASKKETALWYAHTEGKKFFHRELSDLRKQASDQPVAIRQLIRIYLQFLKDSQRHYREYIYKLNTTFGGIPELEAVAHQVKNDGAGESSQTSASPELRAKVLSSCHQTLIYLGDLSRYRASEKLDKNPDFGPAIGYYGLACTLSPSNGMGHHQQAVVALEQRNHLRAIYHLYRAIVVEQPHPHAAKNLKLEFNKVNAAWDRGELIHKAAPNDPESSKRTLVGWFVRLHSMCYRGEPFRGYDELEREVLGQLSTEIKQRSLNATLTRMVMVNLAAQYNAGEQFQENPIQQNQNAFLHFFRINIRTFTTLLRVYYDNLRTVDTVMADAEGEDAVQLGSRLTDITRRTLPALRLYSAWLLPITHLLDGLSEDETLKEAIDQFWPIYAKAVDLIATVFPIWDLEDLPEVSYLMEEDADTLGFKPLVDEKTKKIWCNKQTGATKPRFSDRGIVRASADEEMLARVKDLLFDGLFLANDDDSAPIKLRGTRILHRDAEDAQLLPLPPTLKKVAATPAAPLVQAPKPAPIPKPLSYAAAAASASTTAPVRAQMPNGVPPTSSHSRHAQLSRMVDDLVEDDDGDNNPVTPPQQLSSNPAVVTNGDVTFSALPGSTQDFAQLPDHSYQPKQKPVGTPRGAATSPPVLRTPKGSAAHTPVDRLQSVSSLWDNTPGPQSSMSSHFPAGLPTGTLSSPAQMNSRGHSRVNSASSVRSRTSQPMNMGIADSWSSLESAARAAMPNGLAAAFGNGYGGLEASNATGGLLFGAGGSVWSTSPGGTYR